MTASIRVNVSLESKFCMRIETALLSLDVPRTNANSLSNTSLEASPFSGSTSTTGFVVAPVFFNASLANSK